MRNDELLSLMKRQLFWTRLAVLLCVLMVAVLVAVSLSLKSQVDAMVPQLESTLTQLDDITGKLSSPETMELLDNAAFISGQLTEVDWQEISLQLSRVAEQLGSVDWETMTGDIGDLAQSAQASLETAMEAIDQLDIQGLNKAITDLTAVIEPLANVMRKLS